jgi:ribonuclease HI
MQGWVMLNIDAAFCWESGKASIGSVVHDHTGNVVLAAWRGIWRCGSPEIVEVEACVHGLKIVAKWVKEPTMVESDCQTLISVVASPVVDKAQWSNLITGFKSVAQLLPTCSFRHVRREGNKVAHLLAQHALRTDVRI